MLQRQTRLRYDHFRPLPGALRDAAVASQTLRELGFDVTVLSGRVSDKDLTTGIQDFLNRVMDEAQRHHSLIVFIAIAGHGMMGSCEFPELLASDSDDELSGFDTGKGIILKLNRMRAAERGSAKSICIFDCCRESNRPTIWSPQSNLPTSSRTASLLPSLRNDFYFIFACDQGRTARESESGGLIMQEVMLLLPYAHGISRILEEAILRHNKRARVTQRAWNQNRPGSSVPILGN